MWQHATAAIDGVGFVGAGFDEPARRTVAPTDLAATRSAPRGFLGSSPAAARVRAAIDEAARETELPVLVCGESGVGKERVARAVHDRGRRSRPFVAINVNAFAPTLFESELFGHTRGAFTGAVADRVGALEEAGDGTLLLDEIGDLSRDLQTKLLRIAEERRYRRVGCPTERALHARLISATHCDLDARCRDGSFRWDLCYRLDGLRIEIPPLRERRDDVPILLAHFLAARRPELRLSSGAIEAAMEHDWPGNVRELRTVAQRLALRTAGDVVGADDLRRDASLARRLPPPMSVPAQSAGATSTMAARAADAWLAARAAGASRDEIEAATIRRALADAHGELKGAARRLGIQRDALRWAMTRLGLRDR